MADRMFSGLDAKSVTGTRTRYTITFSILAHVAALLFLVVVPLVATGVLPRPDTIIVFSTIPTPPPPPAPPRQPEVPRSELPTSKSDALTLYAPEHIAPEPDEQVYAPLPGITGGMPAVLSHGDT